LSQCCSTLGFAFAAVSKLTISGWKKASSLSVFLPFFEWQVNVGKFWVWWKKNERSVESFQFWHDRAALFYVSKIFLM
jgi:hypothetical protein